MDTSPNGVCGLATQALGNFTIERDERLEKVKRKSLFFSHNVDALKVSWKGGSGNGTVPGIWLPFKAIDERLFLRAVDLR